MAQNCLLMVVVIEIIILKNFNNIYAFCGWSILRQVLDWIVLRQYLSVL